MSEPAASTVKPRVLLVEDDPMVVKMYTRKLESEGFDIFCGFNGEEGLAALEKDPLPDIVLLDIMMPKMSGLDMLKAAHGNPRYAGLPIIMLTNLGDRAQDMEKCKELGATDYWVKANIHLDDMVKNVRQIISSKKAAKQAS